MLIRGVLPLLGLDIFFCIVLPGILALGGAFAKSTNSSLDKGHPEHRRFHGNQFLAPTVSHSFPLYSDFQAFDLGQQPIQAGKMGPIEQKPQFKKIQNFKADYTEATFTQYESQRTGMRVVVVDRKGPKVYGYFAVATEIHDDTGAPHTLEHLVFMGSRKYPYKGVLDKIATRAYSDTNAWTDTQETVYSLHTAGWEGFAQLLPIYLDHVVVPTITDSGCLTEVHHIDGTGNDAGVVYSEMQGRENLQGDLMDLQMRRLLYPEGNGFRYETGGMMKALRVLTADRIRDFHKEMYQPKNVRVVLIGEVDHDNLLDILDKFEDDIVDVVPSYDAPFKRPWVESKPTPPLSKTVIDTVEFPEEDESTGEIQIAFIGPEANDDKAETVLNTVLMYLAGSSVSVLVNTLVEKEHLGSMVYYWVRAYYDLVIWFTITSVETKKLAEVEKRFFEVLQDHLSKPLDMAYMKDCLRRFKRQVKFTSETSNDEWKDSVIRDHLYGNRDGSHLEEGLSSLRVFEELEDWKEEDWKAFIKKWISDAHHVSLLGKPSLALSDKIKADEAARVKAQQEKFGEDGLKKLAQQLEDAKAENDKPIPEKYLVDLPVPGTDSIHFFDTVTARSGLAKKLGVPENEIQKIIDNDAKNLPLFIHYEHIPTSFVTFGLALGTAAVPLHLKPLLGVYLTNFFTTAVTIDGKRIEFEEVTTRLEQDTIEYSLDRGTDIGNSEMIYIYFVVEQDKFETAVKWLKTMLKDSIFDQERLQSAVQKMLADVPDEKRDGNSMAFAVDRIIHYDKPSAVRATNTLVKAVYLKKLKKLLKEDPKRVIGYFEELRDALVTFSNMRVLAIANFSSLPNPVSTFSHLTEAVTTPSNPDVNPIDDRKTVLSDLGRKPGGAAYIVPMPIDSSFGVLTSAGPNSYTSPQLPPLFVALAYLDAVEGPMWQNIRGTGLAYGANFFKDVETGLLKWRIYKSPNAFSAFKTAKEVVNTYITGERKLEKLALEGAISSIVREFVDEKATIMDAARGSFTDLVVRGVGKDWSDWVLREVRKVKEDDIIQILKDVVINIFDPEKADLVVACGNGQIKEELKKNFEEAGFKHVEVKELHKFQEESQDGYGLEDVKVDDDADEDDEDDDAEGSEEGSDDEMED